jgi:ABC-type uncharacterized transport system substrate-binding protein
MKRALFLALILFSFTKQTACAHPHAFVVCTFSFVMDEKGLAGFRQHWVLDEMTTVSVMDVVDTDHNAALSEKEKLALRDLTTKSLMEFHYFTAVRINGRDFPVRKITDFFAELKENKLIYNFLVPCPVVAISEKLQVVKVAVYDDSFYTYVTYAQQGDAGVDPLRDPLFANRNAPAQPDDFKRFSEAVGISKFNGEIYVTGDTAKFKAESKVTDAPDMAYFYGQIIPQAFVLKFEPR